MKNHRRFRFGFLIGAIILASASAIVARTAQETPAPPAGLAAAEEALRDRNYKKAVEILTRAYPEAKDNKDHVLYLTLHAHHLDGAYDQAIELCDRLLKDHPTSPWLTRALFKKAECLTARQQHEAAQAASEAGLSRLTDPERRRKIAAQFVDAGRGILYPSGNQKPLTSSAADFRKAYPILSQALELHALGADEETVRWECVVCLVKGEFDPKQVVSETGAFLEKFPQSGRADEVLFHHGQALLKLGRWWDARQAWNKLLNDPSNSPFGAHALYEMARFHGIHNRSADLEEIHRGIAYLNRLEQRYPDHELTRNGLWEKALTYSSLPQLHEDALNDLDKFVKKYPKDERAPQGLLLMGDLYLLLQKETKAMETWEDLLKRYPESPRWQEARGRIADLRFQNGYKQFLKGDFETARKALTEFSSQYPADSRIPAIGILLGDILHREKKFKEATDQLRRTAAMHPNSDAASRAIFTSGEILSRDLNDFEQAFKEYDQAQFGPWGQKAKERLTELKSKQLSLDSDRLFTTQEVPFITVSTRNVETVHMRVNALTLTDTLAKKMSFKDLQKLPIDLIAPDKEWEWTVKEYKPFQPFTTRVEIPFRSPGAYIISARAQDVKATVVCLITDLATIAKIGRKGIQILAQDRLTGDEVQTADVTVQTTVNGRLLSDPRIFPSDLALKEGALLTEYKGQSAFQNFTPAGLDSLPDRTSTALVITDKNTYSPGETASVKIIARDFTGHLYTIPKEKNVRLKLIAPNQQTFADRRLTLNETGTAHTQLQLPAVGAVGTWTIAVLEDVRIKPATLAQEKIVVAQPRTDAYHLSFDMPEKTYFVGDELELYAWVTDFTGRPLAGRKLLYTLTGWNEWREIMTSEGGTARITVPETEQFYRTPLITLTIRSPEQPEGSVLGRRQIMLTRKGFEIVWLQPETFRNAIFPEEDRQILFQTRQFDGAPAGQQEVRWELFRTNEAFEKIVEQNSTIKTDPAGQAPLTFRCKSSGPYVLLLQGRDTRGLPVVTWKEFTVAPDAKQAPVSPNAPKLFVRSDREEFAAGDEITLEIVSHLERCHAFLTVEQEEVHHIQRLTLEKGKNPVKINLNGLYLKNFTVAVTVLNGREVYTAERRLRMRRDVTIETAPDKNEYRPGDEVKLKIQLKDHRGRPTQGDVLILVSNHRDRSPDLSVFDPPLPGKYMTTEFSTAHRFMDGPSPAGAEVREAALRLAQQEHQKLLPVRAPLPEPQAAKPSVRQNDPSVPAVPAEAYTLLWNPQVPVNDQGAAEVRFALPHQNGTWFIRICAVTADHGFGTHMSEIRIHKDLTFDLTVPPVTMAGDTASASVFVKNTSSHEKKGEIAWTVSLEEKESVHKTEFTVPPKSVRELTLPLRSETSGSGWVSATLDGITQKNFLTVRPAHPVQSMSLAGWSDEPKVSIQLEPAPPATPDRLKMVLSLSPAAFLHAVKNNVRDTDASPAEAEAAWLRCHLTMGADPRSPVIQESLSRLMLMQQPRGGWPVSSDREDPLDPFLSASVYETMTRARRAGCDVDSSVLTRAADYLKNRFASSDNDETKLLLLHALSTGGEAPFAAINRLYRERETLSTRGMTLLAHLLWETGKKEEAAVVASGLEKRAQSDTQFASWSHASGRNLSWMETPAAVTALAVSALQKITPKSALIEKGVRWLLAHRLPDPPSPTVSGAPLGLWGSPLERAMTLDVLTQFSAFGSPASDPGTLRIEVNGKEIKTLDPKTAMPLETVEIPHRSGAARITLTSTGKDPFLYYIRLDYEASKPADPILRAQAQVTYHHPPLVIDGRPLQSPTVTSKPWEPVSQLKTASAGTGFDVTVRIALQGDQPYRARVSIPIPAGCLPLLNSSDPQVHVHENHLMLVLDKPSAQEAIHTFTFRLHATQPGTYHIRPIRIMRLDRAEELWISSTVSEFTVVESGKEFRDATQLTPGEQYSLGRFYFGRREFKKARPLLHPLLVQGGLIDPFSADVARMLLDISIDEKNHEDTVRFFEILKEKVPSEVVPFERMKELMHAYKSMNEYERHRHILMSTVEALFLQEARLAGLLDDAGQSRSSIETMRRLLVDTPETPATREMRYGLAMKLKKWVDENDAPKPSGWTREELLREAADECRSYLTAHPADPRGDEISLFLITLHLIQQNYAEAENAARAAARRFPDSKYQESYDFTLAYTLFTQKKFDDALTMYDKLMTHDYRGANPTPDVMQDMATLMKAHIYHARGDRTQALNHYKKVKDVYADAREAIKYLERTALAVPEITVMTSDQPSRMDLEYSGLSSVSVKAYKIDLVNVFLSKGSVAVRDIEIPVKPALEKTVTLPNAFSLKKERITLDLEMQAAGAYLVDVRSKEFSTSGFLIRSDLSMEVQEEAQTGTVRVNVMHSKTGKFLENVRVTIIGSGDGKPVSGRTDLRGITEQSGIKGFVTVIAEKDGHYALYKGSASLSGYVPPAQPQPQSGKPTPHPAELNAGKLKALQEEALRKYGEHLQKSQPGVEIQRAK